MIYLKDTGEVETMRSSSTLVSQISGEVAAG